MFDVVAMGELLIDFTPNGSSERGNILYERNPGGAPANVLATLAKMGKKTAFIGKVGRDKFGFFLEETLQKNFVDTSGLLFSESSNTTLAFVHLNEDGDRSFSFYRKPGADLTLEASEIEFSLIAKGKIFHFGSVSMTDDPSRSATLSAVKYAKAQGLIISYDPNLREPLWRSLEEARTIISLGLIYTDLLKVSEKELHFLTGILDLSSASKWIQVKYDIPLIFVTLGNKGCFFRSLEAVGMVPAYLVQAIDTTGAGDAFLGAILYKIIEIQKELSSLTITDLEDCVRFANATGALSTTKKGAIPSLPNLKQIKELMR
jgi:fructokinase